MDKAKQGNAMMKNTKLSIEELLSRGELLCQQEKFEQARDLLQRALEINPDSAPLNNDLGVVLRHLGMVDKSLEYHRKAAELLPSEFIYLKNLADFLLAVKGESKEAMEIYNRILSVDPEDVDALLGVGVICQTIQKEDDARFFLNKVLSLDPNNKMARDQLSLLGD